MKDAIESLLEDDHDSLGELLSKLEVEMAGNSVARTFELLDLFWARLAIHIRAEHLHLFPAVEDAPAALFDRKGLPAASEVRDVVARLRYDHDFFMKELAQMINTMREIIADSESSSEAIRNLRPRLAAVRERLEEHNRLEEQQVYLWPSLVLDETSIMTLVENVRHELENLPGRFH